MKLVIQLHRAIQKEHNIPEKIIKETTKQPLINALKDALSDYPQLKQQLFLNEETLSPLFLLISNGKELKSTKQIYKNHQETQIEIQIIPIYHGG